MRRCFDRPFLSFSVDLTGVGAEPVPTPSLMAGVSAVRAIGRDPSKASRDPRSERKIIRASIVKNRRHQCELQRDLHDTVLRSQVAILQTHELIAKADKLFLSSLAEDRGPGSSSK